LVSSGTQQLITYRNIRSLFRNLTIQQLKAYRPTELLGRSSGIQPLIPYRPTDLLPLSLGTQQLIAYRPAELLRLSLGTQTLKPYRPTELDSPSSRTAQLIAAKSTKHSFIIQVFNFFHFSVLATRAVALTFPTIQLFPSSSYHSLFCFHLHVWF
jgi:hypothetical protein